MHRFLFAPAILLFACSIAAVPRSNAAVAIDLDAATLPAGEITETQNPIAGTWQPNVPLRVQELSNRKAFVFTGSEQLISGLLPAEKWDAFTMEAWVLNPSVERIETVAALCGVKGGSGTEFAYASGASAGAFRSGFKATSPYITVPPAGEWHHLAWTYSGGTLRVFVDGELEVSREMKVTLPVPMKVHVGASGEVDNKGPRKAFSGAVARVRLQNVALNQEELRAGAGFEAPFSPEPRNGATTEGLMIPLRWRAGTVGASASSCKVYLGTDREAVIRGDAGLAREVATSETPPMPLGLGAVYFWRVETVAEGRRISSPVWTFTADRGLPAEPQPRDAISATPASLEKLSWTPGRYASAQRVFFGTNRDEVERGSVSSIARGADAKACAVPAPLKPGTRYFWRVESENGRQPKSQGNVWSFRTLDAPVRDDVTFFVGSDTHYGRENNAAINRRVIGVMNALPGSEFPKGWGTVRSPRGVILTGDLLDEGFQKETAPAFWAEFCRDYGLTGKDGLLCFPLYEGFGNHDGGPTRSFVRAGIRERNPRRVGLTDISPSGLHYSWDWDHVHLVQLNLFGGSGPLDVKGVNGPEHDPEGALDFLKADLAKHVGTTGRPVVVFQHFAWVGGMADWWQLEAKERFREVIKPYRIAALINGHSHGASFGPFHEFLTVHAGSTARGEGDSGDFMVVRITDKEIFFAQRKIDGSWGIETRRPLNAAP